MFEEFLDPERLRQYGYVGIFVSLLAASIFPIPEELPVIVAGFLVGSQPDALKWYIMLPVVMAGVVIGDAVLYSVGRIWGRKLLNLGWVQRKILTPEKREKIEKGFHDRGIAILLGARLLPGIRGPMFVVAGVLRVPLGRFMLADAIYAVPLVNILFWLSYMLTDQMFIVFKKVDEYKTPIISHILAAIAGALVSKFVFSRHVSTGETPHVPDIIAKPAGAIGHAIESAFESAVEVVTGRHHHETPVQPEVAQSQGDAETRRRVEEDAETRRRGDAETADKKTEDAETRRRVEEDAETRRRGDAETDKKTDKKTEETGDRKQETVG